MSLHKLSAGGGVTYLLRHTCCGDVERAADTPLSAYYTASGYPPGRWLGAGLPGLAGGGGVTGLIDETGMDRLFSLGLDPVTQAPLGKVWALHKTATQRIAARVAALPGGATEADRDAAVAVIEVEENRKRTPIAVSGFDLTLTVPKSVSVLWALADPATQTRIANAHRDAVNECLRLIEAQALFTRVGSGGAAQVPVRGAVAAGFDHWDTRTGDPNLHTHLVLANKVQRLDGQWRSVDAKALYAATVAVSEVYDCLIADAVHRDTGATWSLRDRGERRSLAFEIDGVDDVLLAEFSTRSTQVQASLRGLLDDFHTTKGRTPGRVEMIRLRQLATRKSRPAKRLRSLTELLADWHQRATRLLPDPVDQVVRRIVKRGPPVLRAGDVDDHVVRELGASAVAAVMERRSTWTRWNLIAEAARASKTLRLATSGDRLQLLERVAQLAIDEHCLQLTPPQLTPVVADFVRPDGTSAFRRHRADVFTSPVILAAEDRLLAAATTTTGPRVDDTAGIHDIDGTSVGRHHSSSAALAADQRAAVATIASSGRVVDVLVGPAGSGKTTTLRALRSVWEDTFGAGSVIGLAPSATAASELAQALGIGCENTAKWLHETTGQVGRDRWAKVNQLRGMRAAAAAGGDGFAVDRINHAGDTLLDESEPYRLRADQLLVVDEASLAGTLALDQLATQASQAGAKLLLIGDHRQLSSVDAGGAFGLLATETGAIELTSLWRFDHAWEAHAGQQLRVGDASCLDTYAGHGRLHEGPAEAVAANAYNAWDAAISAGQQALLIAADNATVTELNTQARAGRVRDGVVESDGVRLHDDTTAGVGDVIVTRANRRDLRTSTGTWVRNGDLWTVSARDDDGSLLVQRNHRTGARNPRQSVLRLPASYVAEHVELGYATTAHRAQGMTVDATFALLRPGMSRELAYVTLTRGRKENHAFIATDVPDPTYDGAPASEQTGRQILEQILATSSTQASATETLRALQDDATSLGALAPIHETLVQEIQRHHWAKVITGCGLTPDQSEQVLTSPAYGPLVAALRRAENDGHPMHRVLPALAAAAPLAIPENEEGNEANDGAQPARDIAAVLHHRVTHWHEHTPRTQGRQPQLIGGIITPVGQLDGAPTDQVDAVHQLETLMANRVNALVRQALQRPPAWLRALGPPPADPRRRASWTQAVTVIAAYRDRYTVPEHGHPLGTIDIADPDQALARRRALAVGRQARTVTSSLRRTAVATTQSPHQTPSL
jgi:conjugative relaxase-like TrwC/TraI family protein